MYERCHRGVLARNPEWISVARGERRESTDADGFKVVTSRTRYRLEHLAPLSQPDGGKVMLAR